MTLDSDFEDKLEEAVLDEAEHQLIGKRDNAVFNAVQAAHDILRSYGREFDYNVEPIIDSLVGPEVERSDSSLTIRWGWAHEAAMFFEFGTSDHTVDGDPVLVFEFDADEYPYLAEMFPDGTAFLPEVKVAGIKETRFARDALHALRRDLQR